MVGLFFYLGRKKHSLSNYGWIGSSTGGFIISRDVGTIDAMLERLERFGCIRLAEEAAQ
jgi:hypothetical protein